MKKLLLFVLFIATNTCLAVPLSGTYTIGATASDYTTIALAVQALTTEGVSGPVIFNIAPGTYLNASASLPLITGSSETNTITFRSATANADDVILRKPSNTVFSIIGKYFRFQQLTFQNTAASSSTMFTLTDSCADISIVNCKFTGGGTSAYVLLYGNNIHIDSNTFAGATSAIFRNNGSGPPESNNVFVTKNIFAGVYVDMIDVNKIRNFVFSGNTNTAQVGGITLRATNLAGANFFEGNNLKSANTNITSPNYAIHLSGRTTEASDVTVSNNFFAVGRTMYAGSFANVNLYNNSFRTADSYCLSLENNTLLQKFRIYNNIFWSSDAYQNIRYISSLPFAKVEMDNNAYNKDRNTIVYYNPITPSTTLYDLNAWKLFSPLDQSSLMVHDVYASQTDLHTPNAILLNGAGSAIPAIATDIDGQTRNTIPDIGADEFDMDLATYLDLEMVNIASPVLTGCDQSPFILSVKNNSVFAVNSFSIECSLNGYRGNESRYTQTINAGETVQVTLNACEIVKNTYYDKFDFYISDPDNLMENNYANNKISFSDLLQLGSFTIQDETNPCNNEHRLYVPRIDNTTLLWSTGATTSPITVTAPGTYTVTFTATNGCSITQSITIN